ncbi:MAG: Mth938-like domain-containing protein [Rhodospirillales bacterium]|nr:Mth938-like domain-containing protein [Rhodospirillales bacterium]
MQSYGEGRFRVNREIFDRPIIVFPEAVITWDVVSFEALSSAHFQPVIDAAAEVDILLLGCGPAMQLVTSGIREKLKKAAITIESMDTGAACRTYNVLLTEERRIAAALFPLD